MKGLEGKSFAGIIVYGGLESSSGKHSPIERDFMSTPTLFRDNFSLILTTSSNWCSLYLDLLWCFKTSEKPLFLEEYWQIDEAASRSSLSTRLSIVPNFFLKLLSRSLLIDFSNILLFYCPILGKWYPAKLISECRGLVLKLVVNPYLI